MKKTIKIFSILFYILFTQVYPIVHWHAHEDQDEIELHVIVHPPDFPTDGAGHKDHHEHSGAHDQHLCHFDGDWNYVHQSKLAKIQISNKYFSSSIFVDLKTQVPHRPVFEEIQNITNRDTFFNPSNRAPPRYC